jgi:WD40 repeat protein
MGHGGEVLAVVFSPDGKTVFTGSADNTARFWNVSDAAPFAQPMVHPDHVTAVAFSPDGRTAVTVSRDKIARLWRVPMALGAESQQIVLWAEVITGMRLSEAGVFGKTITIQFLDREKWNEERRKLNERSGGRPIP